MFFFLSACPKIVIADKVVCDPLLRVEIEESRAMNEQTARTNIIEDFTEDSEVEDSDWKQCIMQSHDLPPQSWL